MLEHPPYSPDLAPTNLWVFPKIKAALAGHFMDSGTFKTEWDGVISLIDIQEYQAAS